MGQEKWMIPFVSLKMAGLNNICKYLWHFKFGCLLFRNGHPYKTALSRNVFVENTPESDIDMASIKRIKKWEKSFVLLSDNPNFPPVLSPLDWNRLCVGRVVWIWRVISYLWVYIFWLWKDMRDGYRKRSNSVFMLIRIRSDDKFISAINQLI